MLRNLLFSLLIVAPCTAVETTEDCTALSKKHHLSQKETDQCKIQLKKDKAPEFNIPSPSPTPTKRNKRSQKYK